jgi:hypothetical protein
MEERSLVACNTFLSRTCVTLLTIERVVRYDTGCLLIFP